MKRILVVLSLALCATAAMAQVELQPPDNEDDAILIAQGGPVPAQEDNAIYIAQGEPAPDVQMHVEGHAGGPGMGVQTSVIERHGPMKFWNDSEIATKIKLTDDQKQKLESTFTSYRLKLIDQRAAVEREEVKLEPLVQSDKLDEGAITKQIDALISARGQLERTTAMMGVDIRKVLSPEQWKQLREMHGMGMGFGHGIGLGAPGGPGGPGERGKVFRYHIEKRGDGPTPPPPPPPGDDDKGPK